MRRLRVARHKDLRHRTRHLVSPLIVGAATVGYGCGGEAPSAPETPQNLSLVIASGNHQVRFPGTIIDGALAVALIDEEGDRVSQSGVPIKWSIASGDASLEFSEVVTGPQGSAIATVLLGTTLGPVSVKAAIASGDVTFALSVIEPGDVVFLSEHSCAPPGFDPNRDRNQRMFVMDMDGGSIAPLTDKGNCDQDWPDWSPDGLWLAYTQREETSRTGGISVARANQSGLAITAGAPANLVPDDATHADWSPDGLAIAYALDWDDPNCRPVFVFDSRTSGHRDIYVINRDGTGERRLTVTDNECFSLTDAPDWSPDGSMVAYHSRALHNGTPAFRIWMVDADGSNPHALTGGKFPAWHPVGDRLAFVRGDDLMEIMADGTGERLLYDGTAVLRGQFDSGHLIGYVNWSADGSQILLTESHPDGERILVLEIATGQVTDITPLSLGACCAAWRN